VRKSVKTASPAKKSRATNKSAIEARPPAFVYRSSPENGRGSRELHCEGIPLAGLAELYGTPLYVYSRSNICERYAEFERAFAKQPHTICYSVKANSNLTVLKTLAELGSGFDVVSGGELHRVISADQGAASKVVFSGVGKTAAEMDAALAADILMFNLESEAELELLASRATALRKTARIAFRVNPDVKAETHPYITTGLREHKFGVPIDRARELYALAATHEYLEPAGVSAHIGSQIIDIDPFGQTIERLVSLATDLLSDGLNIRYVDVGGGLGIPYTSNSNESFSKRVDSYAKHLLRFLRKTDFHLLMEPGRAIVAAAGTLVTSALYCKPNGNKQFVVVDAAMNDLIRPALYSAYHEIVPVVSKSATKNPASQVVDVVGPICETGDFFGRDRELPAVVPGDLLAVLDAGAYGMSLSSNYNTRPRAAEVMVEGSRVRLIRRRETLEDLLRYEY
jgi:diaminopimelate decarboxylase